ncbi:MAG: alpha-ketoglutarate-dependent dioxygenase AlkB [Raineya sp.]|jgi:hypothetical protein|nr:alpha-ketoglutarate-dependent dioxygenase AlkB [Raineya sp.]
MKHQNFYQWVLPLETDLFQRLSDSVEFEDIGKGRKGNHLVDCGERGIPIVRTTTQYNTPACKFSQIHHNLIESIRNKVIEEIGDISMRFNNALIEVYESSYFKMKYHSDQALDLAENSYIALFSCYEKPNDITKNVIRKLQIIHKETQEESELILENNSVVLFSTASNMLFQHKITSNPPQSVKGGTIENRWLGITLRLSKTFIEFKENLPYFENGELLTLAQEEQRKAFFLLRGQENNSTDFSYPHLTYTISPADMMMPKE